MKKEHQPTNMAQKLLELFMARLPRIPRSWAAPRVYPYSSKRQLGIRGVNHPMAAQTTLRNPRDFTGKAWGR